MPNYKTPHHLKAVTGNPGKRPMGEPPAKVDGKVMMPRLLVAGRFAHVERARELWDALSPALIVLEILNPVTAIQFGNWCEMQARYEEDPTAFNAAMVARLQSLGSLYALDYVSWEKLTAGKGQEATADPTDEFFAA